MLPFSLTSNRNTRARYHSGSRCNWKTAQATKPSPTPYWCSNDLLSQLFFDIRASRQSQEKRTPQSPLWKQIESLTLFKVFVDRKYHNKAMHNNCATLDDGLLEFLKYMGINSKSWQFKQVLLFYATVAVSIIENNSPDIIDKASVDLSRISTLFSQQII
jgi:hypothetical protein